MRTTAMVDFICRPDMKHGAFDIAILCLDGSLYHPNVEKTDTLQMYQPPLCRLVVLKVFYFILSYKYVANPSLV